MLVLQIQLTQLQVSQLHVLNAQLVTTALMKVFLLQFHVAADTFLQLDPGLALDAMLVIYVTVPQQHKLIWKQTNVQE